MKRGGSRNSWTGLEVKVEQDHIESLANIHVKKWSTIITEAKWRYQFFREKLELEVTTAHGLRYLREKHGDRMPEASANDVEES